MSTTWRSGMERRYGPSPYKQVQTDLGPLHGLDVGACWSLVTDDVCGECGQRVRRPACVASLWLVRFGTTFEVVRGCEHKVVARYERRFRHLHDVRDYWSARPLTDAELATLAQWSTMEIAAREAKRAPKREQAAALRLAIGDA